MLPNYLHNHKHFRQLIEITANELGIDEPSLVEKDYWITHCLYGLQKAGLIFELKGGTSLSKGYGIIHRFSEDIDIKIDPPIGQSIGFEIYTAKNHDKFKHKESRRKYFDWLTEFLDGKIDGVISVVRDTNFDNEKYRSGGIRLHYKTSFPVIPGIKEGILLEVGFDRTAPNQPKTITSWALNKAIATNVDVINNQALHVPCYEPKFTFVEKLQAIVRKFKQYKKQGNIPDNFMRHYYDIYYLLKLKDVQNFIGTQQYTDFKKERFCGDDISIINSDAFKIINTDDLELFQSEYNKTRALYYQGQIELMEILNFIGLYLDKL